MVYETTPELAAVDLMAVITLSQVFEGIMQLFLDLPRALTCVAVEGLV